MAQDNELEHPTSLTEKEAGNDLFRAGEYDDALIRYRNALELCHAEEGAAKDQSVILSNIAACHYQKGSTFGVELIKACINLKQNQYEECVKLCSEALELNPEYLKARVRRANACEHIGKGSSLEMALDDWRIVVEKETSANKKAEANKKVQSLPGRIAAVQEREKQEMLSQLKDLGNKFLGNFGLSTDSFQFTPNGDGGYSMSIKK
ncbi:hypothetical protein HDV05_006824 [Chytridiales sp. JEL 0842]|nr:hypothetical protein HDV05_006824 [Chytridiales sp. JEL 0842]